MYRTSADAINAEHVAPAIVNPLLRLPFGREMPGPGTRWRTERSILRTILVATMLAGCDRSVLTVDLRTDLVPGEDFEDVETEIVGVGTERLLVEQPAREDYVRGVRVGRFELADSSLVDLRVVLRSRGSIVAERSMRLRAQRASIASVLITRDCRGVVCGEMNGVARSCVAGACADVRCSEQTPEFCPPAECVADSECPPPAASCAVARCADGRCLAASAAACGEVEWCDPDAGCRPKSDGALEVLTLQQVGDGLGELVPTPLGAPCGAGCYAYPRGTSVTVEGRATRSTDRFLGFMGEATRSCVGRQPCTVTLDTPRALVGGFGAVRRFADVFLREIPTVFGMDVAPDGTLFLALADGLIGRVAPGTQTLEVLAGDLRPGYAEGTDPRFAYPRGVDWQPGPALLIADRGNHRVRHYDLTTRTASTWAGTGEPGATTGPRLSAQIDAPEALFLASDGAVYVADQGSDRLLQIDPSGDLRQLARVDVRGIAESATTLGSFLVGDAYANRVGRLTGGRFRWVGGSGANIEGYRDGADPLLSWPYGIAALPDGSFLMVSRADVVRELRTDDTIHTFAGGGTERDGWDLDLDLEPTAIAVAPDGTVYIGTDDPDRALDGRVLRLR